MTYKAPPTFNFYHSDFIGGTAHMTAAEAGGYIRLLCWQFVNGSIPRAKDRFLRIAGLDHGIDPSQQQAALSVLMEKFEAADETGDNLVNPRMAAAREKEFEGWLRRKEVNRENGRKGGRPRKTESKPNGLFLETETKPISEEGKGKREKGRRKVEGGKRKAVFPEVLNTGEFRDAWAAWIDSHGKYKPQGEKAQLTRLAAWGHSRACQAIEYSLAQGFKGIYEEQTNGKSNDMKRVYL